mgnify:CR=1 FL=1
MHLQASGVAAIERAVVNPDARGTRDTRDADRAAVVSLSSGREAVYFAEGRMESEAGNYRRAAELLELSHAASGSAVALVSAANMYHKLGELGHAEMLYTQASA